jgi:hypothetical protein
MTNVQNFWGFILLINLIGIYSIANCIIIYIYNSQPVIRLPNHPIVTPKQRVSRENGNYKETFPLRDHPEKKC